MARVQAEAVEGQLPMAEGLASRTEEAATASVRLPWLPVLSDSESRVHFSPGAADGRQISLAARPCCTIRCKIDRVARGESRTS